MVERDDLAIDKQIRERASLFRDGLKFFGPVQTFSGLQRGLAVLDPQLHSVAVEFDFVAPSLPTRGAIDRPAQLRRYEIRDRADFLAFCRRGRRFIFLTFFFCPRLRGIAPVRMPERVGPAASSG